MTGFYSGDQDNDKRIFYYNIMDHNQRRIRQINTYLHTHAQTHNRTDIQDIQDTCIKNHKPTTGNCGRNERWQQQHILYIICFYLACCLCMKSLKKRASKLRFKWMFEMSLLYTYSTAFLWVCVSIKSSTSRCVYGFNNWSAVW